MVRLLYAAAAAYFIVSATLLIRVFLVYPAKEQAWLFSLLFAPAFWAFWLVFLARAYARNRGNSGWDSWWRAMRGVGIMWLIGGVLLLALVGFRKSFSLPNGIADWGFIMGGLLTLLTAWKARSARGEKLKNGNAQ